MIHRSQYFNGHEIANYKMYFKEARIMNKKSLLRKMSIVVASATMMVTALPLTASAYTGFTNGSYATNANLYVPQAETPLK